MGNGLLASIPRRILTFIAYKDTNPWKLEIGFRKSSGLDFGIVLGYEMLDAFEASIHYAHFKAAFFKRSMQLLLFLIF